MAEPKQDVVFPECKLDHRVPLRVDGELVNATELCQCVELLQRDEIGLLEFKVLRQ